jgi:hypothetical protein
LIIAALRHAHGLQSTSGKPTLLSLDNHRFFARGYFAAAPPKLQGGLRSGLFGAVIGFGMRTI